jgi:D-alanyl-D-alanine carboxypeptidase
MNDKADDLGLSNTEFHDPAGLNDEGHSTPRDIALLLNYLLDDPQFLDIIHTPKKTIYSADNRYKHELTNSNRLIDPEENLYYPQALGGKTGFTFEAGHCLATAAQTESGQRLIAVVLHTNEESKEASAREARKLLVWGAQ